MMTLQWLTNDDVAMADREKKKGKMEIFKNLSISRTKRAF